MVFPASARYAATMHVTLRRAVAAFLMAGVLGCGLFDSGSARRKGATANARCDVDLDQWKARVKRFKDKKHQNKAEFQQAKDDLVNDLKRLDTEGCKRELRSDLSDLVDEVKQERF